MININKLVPPMLICYLVTLKVSRLLVCQYKAALDLPQLDTLY